MRTHTARALSMVLLSLLACASGAPLGGCYLYHDTHNPSFPVTELDAQADERRMRADSKTVERPVLVIGGFRSPDPFIESMAMTLARMTTGNRDDFMRLAMWFEGDIDAAARELVDLVHATHPSPNDEETVEIDVVGLSMGGLVARYAADRLHREDPTTRRLKINRLMTIATPHRGAPLAERSPLVEDRAVVDMYRGSLFLTKLEEAYEGDYTIIPYARLRDGVVGAINAAPPGRTPIWVSGPILGGSHLTINEDKRILTDIARRLRGEEPRGVEGEPLPEFELGRR